MGERFGIHPLILALESHAGLLRNETRNLIGIEIDFSEAGERF